MEFATVRDVCSGRAYLNPTTGGHEGLSFKRVRVLDQKDGQPWHTRAMQPGKWQVGDLVALHYVGHANGCFWQPVWCVPGDMVPTLVDRAVCLTGDLATGGLIVPAAKAGTTTRLQMDEAE